MFFDRAGTPLGLYACGRFLPPYNDMDFTEEEKRFFDRSAPYIFYAFRKYRYLLDYDFFSLTSPEDLPAGLVLASDKGKISWMNSAAEKLFTDYFGASPKSISGHLKQAEATLEEVASGETDCSLIFRTIEKSAPYGAVICFRVEADSIAFLPGHGAGTLFLIDLLRINREILGMLTKRERAVTRHLLEGRLDKEIADELSLSEKTIHTHMRSIFKKIGVSNRTEAAVMALKLGL